jgi:hypothetical protein
MSLSVRCGGWPSLVMPDFLNQKLPGKAETGSFTRYRLNALVEIGLTEVFRGE